MAISLRDLVRPDLLVYQFVPPKEEVVELLQGDIPTCADFYLTNGGRLVLPNYAAPNNGRYIGRFTGNFEFVTGKIIPFSDVITIFPDIEVQTIDQLLELFRLAPQKIKERQSQAIGDLQRFLGTSRRTSQ